MADAANIFEDDFLGDNFTVGDFDAAEFFGSKRGDKELVFPFWKQIAGVKVSTARCDRRHPVSERLLHAIFSGDVDHGGSIIIHAVGDDGPAVVEAFFDEVEFVAAAGPVLSVEEFSGYRVEGEALRVAVAIAPDGGIGFSVTDEGIIGGDAAVVVEAMDFAVGARDILSVRALAAFADGEVEITLAIEGDTAAKVNAAGFNVVLKFALVNRLLIDESAVFDFAANDTREADLGAVGVLLGIAEGKIEPAVVGIIGMSNDVEQSGLACGVDGGHTT